jgi:hypothetical protein
MSVSAQKEYAKLQKANGIGLWEAQADGDSFITRPTRPSNEVGGLSISPTDVSSQVLAGAPLTVQYLQTPAQLGRPDAKFAEVTMHYRIDGALFPPVKVGGTDAKGKYSAIPAEINVPGGASKNIEYWFEAKTTTGETLWDSNFGNNFKQPIAAMSAAPTPSDLRPLTMLPDYGSLASSVSNGNGSSVQLGDLGVASSGSGRRANIGYGTVKDVSYFKLDVSRFVDPNKVSKVVLEVQGANGGGQLEMNRIYRDDWSTPDSQDDVVTKIQTRQFLAQIPTSELLSLAGKGDLPYRMRVETTDGRTLYVTDHGAPVDPRDVGMKMTQMEMTRPW